jgi:hypothetical protein
MKVISVTVHATGGLEIQDPFPAEGRLVVDILPGGAATFAATTGQYNRIRPQLDAAVTAGIITALLVNETDAERTDQYMETKKVVPPGPRTGYGRYFTGLDGNPYFETELGAIIMLAVAGGSAITFIGTIANAGQFPLVGVAKSGWLYLMVGNATDPVTGASFTTDDEIIWNGTRWSLAGTKRGQTVVDAATMGPIYTVLDADEFLLVDVTAGPITIDFPTAVGKKFKRYELLDVKTLANTNNILITIAGVPLSALDIDGSYVAIESDGTDWNPVCEISAVTQAMSHARGNGMDHSSVTDHDNRLLAIGSGAQLFEDDSQAVSVGPGPIVIRAFRAISPGSIAALVAECGAIPAAGESMTVDVTINAVSACTAPAVLDAATSPAPATPVAAVINPLASAYVAGDVIEIYYTYVAGMGPPTPIAFTIADLEVVRA